MPQDQARLIFDTLCSLGGRHVKFPDICKELGTEDTTQYREGLNLLLEEKKIIKHGEKRGANYSVNYAAVNDSGEMKDGTIIVTENISSTPLERLISFVADGIGYSQNEVIAALNQQFPDSWEVHLKTIKDATANGLISFNREKRGPEGYFVYIYPPGVGKNCLIINGEPSPPPERTYIEESSEEEISL